MIQATLWRAILAAAMAGPALAQAGDAPTVTVVTRQGGFVLAGTVQGYDGRFLRLSTEDGPVTVELSEVDCTGPACPDPSVLPLPEIRVSGDPALGTVLLPALVETFAARQGLSFARSDPAPDRIVIDLARGATPVGRLRIALSSTAEGFADLAADETDWVMAARPVRGDEAARALEAGAGDLAGPGRMRRIALDAAVPAVSTASALAGVSLPMLAALWSGEIADWQRLTGVTAPVAVHDPAAGSGLAEGFADRVLVPAGLEAAGTVVRHDDPAELARALAQDPTAIGLARFPVPGGLRALPLVAACGRRLEATEAALKAGDYPLAMPLALYLPARPLPQVFRDFLAFLDSPAAALVVRRTGLVDTRPVEIPLGAQGQRLANAVLALDPGADGAAASLAELRAMLRRLAGADRLSTTFRFRDGSTRLDAASEFEVGRLASEIVAGHYSGRQILLAGFSDGDGPAAANRDLATARAETVRAALAAEIGRRAGSGGLRGLRLDRFGFGEALPIACDDSDWGRQINRRVEVWLR